jgi:hypothetical protein
MTNCATVTALPTGPRYTPVQDLTSDELDRRVRAAGNCVGATADRVNEIWFPSRTITEDEARNACAGCPVIAECLEQALREEAKPGVDAHGVFGGRTPRQRNNMRRSPYASEAVAS